MVGLGFILGGPAHLEAVTFLTAERAKSSLVRYERWMIKLHKNGRQFPLPSVEIIATHPFPIGLLNLLAPSLFENVSPVNGQPILTSLQEGNFELLSASSSILPYLS